MKRANWAVDRFGGELVQTHRGGELDLLHLFQQSFVKNSADFRQGLAANFTDDRERRIVHLGVAVRLVVPEPEVQQTVDKVGGNGHLGVDDSRIVLNRNRG